MLVALAKYVWEIAMCGCNKKYNPPPRDVVTVAPPRIVEGAQQPVQSIKQVERIRRGGYIPRPLKRPR